MWAVTWLIIPLQKNKTQLKRATQEKSSGCTSTARLASAPVWSSEAKVCKRAGSHLWLHSQQGWQHMAEKKRETAGFYGLCGGFVCFFIGFCCLGGGFWFCFFKYTDKDKFHKAISSFDQFTEANPNTGRFLSLRGFVTYTLSRCLLKKKTKHKLLYKQQKAPRSLLPTFLQSIIFKIHFIFSW